MYPGIAVAESVLTIIPMQILAYTLQFAGAVMWTNRATWRSRLRR